MDTFMPTFLIEIEGQSLSGDITHTPVWSFGFRPLSMSNVAVRTVCPKA